jgi:hypothetical protein
MTKHTSSGMPEESHGSDFSSTSVSTCKQCDAGGDVPMLRVGTTHENVGQVGRFCCVYT